MKKGLKVLLVLMVLGLSILVLAELFTLSGVLSNARPSSGQNVTGSINLNVTILTNMTNGNYSVQNVTFAWMNMSSHRVHNTTIFNISNGQTSFQNTSFDTRLLPDGVYNVTITAYNNSGVAVGVNANSTIANNITVDNTAPSVNVSHLGLAGSYPPIQSGQNFSVAAARVNTSFNATIYDFRPGQTGNAYAQFELGRVYFWFDNGTGNDFNLTAVNNSGSWSVSYNLSLLSNGNEFQTVRVMANDSMSNGTRNNLNNSVFWNFTVDGTNPVVTASSSSVASTSATLIATINESIANCTYGSLVGGLSGTLTKDTNTRFTAGLTLTAGSSYQITITCTDFGGNSDTDTTSFAATAAAAAASSGGSGSGGSSGGISSGVQGSFEKKVWTSIDAGETASVTLKNGVVGVTEVSLTVPSTVYGAWISVAKKDSLPSSVSSFSDKVYKYVEITKGPALAKEGAFTDATIKFKVEKVWLAEKQLTKEAVALHHYLNGGWTQLSTTVGEDDGTYVHYSAKTPGFSYFVIGEKSGAATAEVPAEAAPVEAPTEEAAAEAAPEEAAMEQKGKNTTLLVGVLAALVVIVAVVVYLKKRR